MAEPRQLPTKEHSGRYSSSDLDDDVETAKQ